MRNIYEKHLFSGHQTVSLISMPWSSLPASAIIGVSLRDLNSLRKMTTRLPVRLVAFAGVGEIVNQGTSLVAITHFM